MDIEKELDSGAADGVIEEFDGSPESALHTDIAFSLYNESLALDPTRRAQVAARVKRKLDFILLPMVSPRLCCIIRLC